jgi:hypothetical protein
MKDCIFCKIVENKAICHIKTCYYKVELKGKGEDVDPAVKELTSLDSHYDIIYTGRHKNKGEVKFDSVIGAIGRQEDIETLLKKHNHLSSVKVNPVNKMEVDFESVPYNEKMAGERSEWYNSIWQSFGLKGNVKATKKDGKFILKGSFSGSPEDIAKAVETMSGTASFDYKTE